MTNQEIILKDLKYLNDCGVHINIYHSITNFNNYILENNGTKINFEASELKKYLEDLKNNVIDLEEEQAKKRRLMRSLLLEASEEIAKKFNKQVYTLSIGEVER